MFWSPDWLSRHFEFVSKHLSLQWFNKRLCIHVIAIDVLVSLQSQFESHYWNQTDTSNVSTILKLSFEILSTLFLT